MTRWAWAPHLLVGLLGACAAPAPAGAEAGAPVAGAAHAAPAWAPWSAEAFARARAERRPILVVVAAGWCHWCHVMDAETFADPEVRALLDARFVALRVDADARPDLAERYREWGWPAIALLTPDARPIAERRGHQERAGFLALLRRVADDVAAGRDPGRPPPPAPAGPAPDLQAALAAARAQLDGFWDEAGKGWGGPQKYPLAAPVEHALLRAALRPAEATWRGRALATLEAQRALLDPVDGGMFQYSTDGTWGGARHFEKIVDVNAGALEAYAAAARAAGDPRWLGPARDVARWVLGPLRDPATGALFTSQDADPPPGSGLTGAEYHALDAAGRRRVPAPRVDRSVHADANGWLAAGLLRLHAAAGDPALLAAACAALERLFATHAALRGGLRHAAADPPDAVLHLADQVGPATACLLAHEATGDARWRARALELARVLRDRLEDPATGAFFAHTPDPAAAGVFAARRRPVRENAQAARLLLHLEALTGEGAWGDAARRALLAVAPDARAWGRLIGELVLALEEAALEPVKLVVVARPDDPAAAGLRAAARRLWAPRLAVASDLPGGAWPDLGRPAVFACGGGACSPPVLDPADLPRAVAVLAPTPGR